MAEIRLHVYDVTNCGSNSTNDVIVQLNNFTRDAMKFGGIFHGGVEIHGLEWSYGYCEKGSGVYSMTPMKNPMYKHRETLSLGITLLDEKQVNQILVKLSKAWSGQSYDLLSRNCNHFCDELCQCLGVGRIPNWVNRFASAADVAVEVAETTAGQLMSLRENVSIVLDKIWNRGGSQAEAPKLVVGPSMDSLGEVATLCSPTTEHHKGSKQEKAFVFSQLRQPFMRASQEEPEPSQALSRGRSAVTREASTSGNSSLWDDMQSTSDLSEESLADYDFSDSDDEDDVTDVDIIVRFGRAELMDHVSMCVLPSIPSVPINTCAQAVEAEERGEGSGISVAFAKFSQEA